MDGPTESTATYSSATDYETFDYVNQSIAEEETFHFLGFEFLHRFNIVQIQNEIIKAREEIFTCRGIHTDKTRLKALLSDYSTAIQNYNHVHQSLRLDSQSTATRKQRLKASFPSITTSSRAYRPFESHYYYLLHDGAANKPDILRDKLRQWLPVRLTYSAQEKRFRAKEFEEGRNPRDISKFVDNTVRLCVALLAGAFLIGPMCVMSIHPSLTKSLITSSVFTILFACGLSFGIKSTNVETLIATATYSAVLVVFVGSSTGNFSA